VTAYFLPIIFPQIANGDKYKTRFIFLSAGGASDNTHCFHDERGMPSAIGKIEKTQKHANRWGGSKL
jgi:hypothetical protein